MIEARGSSGTRPCCVGSRCGRGAKDAQVGYDVLNVVRLGWEPSSGSVELCGVVNGVVPAGRRQ